MVVSRGYFSHDSSHSKKLASAHRVELMLQVKLNLGQNDLT